MTAYVTTGAKQNVVALNQDAASPNANSARRLGDDEGHVQGLRGLLLGLLPPSVIPSRGGDTGVAHKPLYDADVNPGIKKVGHAGSTQVVR